MLVQLQHKHMHSRARYRQFLTSCAAMWPVRNRLGCSGIKVRVEFAFCALLIPIIAVSGRDNIIPVRCAVAAKSSACCKLTYYPDVCLWRLHAPVRRTIWLNALFSRTRRCPGSRRGIQRNETLRYTSFLDVLHSFTALSSRIANSDNHIIIPTMNYKYRRTVCTGSVF